ncbi:MAG: tRNA (adenosine(37)-N6)-dimethylallyltransferase MiaA [Myxococcota bacterium]
MTASPPRNPVVVLTGPTASGKTSLAIALANRFDGEIVNADSMQVYRGLDIGTAKPTIEERAAVPHHLIDVVAPDQTFSAGRYARAARAAIAGIQERGHRPFLVGGTGLYIRAVLHGLIDGVEAEPELREQLETEAAEAAAAGDPGRLHRRLADQDPDAAARIHPNDTRRVVRALEIATETGRGASQVRGDHGFDDSPYDTLHLALDWEREALYERIDRRCEAMIEQGLLRELRGLAKAGYGPELRSMKAIGYRHVWPVVRGEDTLASALVTLQRDTRHFARRQLTWLRKVPDVVWVDPRDPEAIAARVAAFFEGEAQPPVEASAGPSGRV